MSAPKRAKRAKRGSITGALLLRLPAPLLKHIKMRAKREGLSQAEWVRRVLERESDNWDLSGRLLRLVAQSHEAPEQARARALASCPNAPSPAPAQSDGRKQS